MTAGQCRVIDKPIGTACGFAVTSAASAFIHTRCCAARDGRMLDEQVTRGCEGWRLKHGVTRAKRFHSFGTANRPRRQMLGDMEALTNGNIKAASSAYPQLEDQIAIHAESDGPASPPRLRR